jgi:hypothetical protein
MVKLLVSVILVIAAFSPFYAKADTATLDQQLRNHTFVYVDKKTNLEHTVYFGRFGNVYDEYFRHMKNQEFPCAFVDGTWKVTANGAICLKDSEDKSRRDGKTCWKPKINGTQISFFDTAGKLAFQSKLNKGNGMPLG